MIWAWCTAFTLATKRGCAPSEHCHRHALLTPAQEPNSVMNITFVRHVCVCVWDRWDAPSICGHVKDTWRNTLLLLSVYYDFYVGVPYLHHSYWTVLDCCEVYSYSISDRDYKLVSSGDMPHLAYLGERRGIYCQKLSSPRGGFLVPIQTPKSSC